MSRPGGSGPSAPRAPEDGAALSVRRLKRIAEDGPPVVGTIKRRRGGFAGNDSGLPPSVGFAGPSGGRGRGRGRGGGGAFNHGGGNNANRGGHANRGGPHRGRGGGGNNFRGGRGQPGGSRGRGRGRGRGKGGFQPTGANAEPQTDYYSTGADIYADYADVGTGEEVEHGQEEDYAAPVPKSPPRGPRIGRPEVTDSYRPERHALPPRPDVRSPGASPQRSMPPPSSPPRMLPPSTPAQPTPSRGTLLSSSPVARFHLDSDMVFELASEADDAEHEEVSAEKEMEKEKAARKGYGEYTYSPSSPLPDLAASTHEAVSRTFNDSPWNSALGLTTNAAPAKSTDADKGKQKEKEKQLARPPLPPLEKDDKLAPKPLKIKPMNRNVRKNDPPKPPSLAPPKEKEQGRSTSKSPLPSRPPLPSSSRSKSPISLRPPLATSSASTIPATSKSTATTSSSSLRAPTPARKHTPEPIDLSSSPLVATTSLPAPTPRSPEDVKPNLALLAPPSPPPARAASAPREGVLALRRADLPTDCFSTDRIRRVPARHIVAQDAKARVVAEGKIVLGTRWRDDGFCVDWQLPTPPEDSDDSDDSSVEFVAAPPRPPPPVVELLDSSDDEEPLARKSKGKRRHKKKGASSEEAETSRAQSAAATTTTNLSPTRSPAPRTFARIPSTGTQRGVDSSTLPHDPETPETGLAALPPVDGDERDAAKWAAYVEAHPNGSIVFPFPAKFRTEDSRKHKGYARWKERQLALLRTQQSHVASNEVTCTETDGSDGWGAPGLRVRWRALSEEEIAAAVEKRRRERRERKEAKKAAKEALEAGRRAAEARPSEPNEPAEAERRSTASWVAAQDRRPAEERDELDEEESKDDIAERAARQEKERKKADRALRKAMAEQPQDSAPRPSASPAVLPTTLPSHPHSAPTRLHQPVALPAQPAQAVGSVPSPPPSPVPPTETSAKDAEIARLLGELKEALETMSRWQQMMKDVPEQADVCNAQIAKITVEVFTLQEELTRVRGS